MDFVTPEMFGAVGDGVTDDTKSLQLAFDTRRDVVLDKTYYITENIKVSSSFRGKGSIIFGKDYISLRCSGDNLSLSGVTLNYMHHTGKMLRLHHCNKIEVKDMTFLNVGSLLSSQSIGMVYISDHCNNVTFKKCFFKGGYAGNNFACSGIWISQKNGICEQISINMCTFEEFISNNDADAIKIIGDSSDCFLYVNNCVFKSCKKRAMKFQARCCYSSNNTIIVDSPMYTAIAFQCGNGSSINDKIVLHSENSEDITNDKGLLYRGITISGNNVHVKGLKIVNNKPLYNSHQFVFGLNLSNSNKKLNAINDILIEDCIIDGMDSFLIAGSNVKAINGLRIINNRLRRSNRSGKIISLGHVKLDGAQIQVFDENNSLIVH